MDYRKSKIISRASPSPTQPAGTHQPSPAFYVGNNPTPY